MLRVHNFFALICFGLFQVLPSFVTVSYNLHVGMLLVHCVTVFMFCAFDVAI